MHNLINPMDRFRNEPTHIIEIFLQPGQFYWGDHNTRIRTLLGSCIAICFWHPITQEGGMAHIMLPERAVKGQELDPRYADEAMLIFMEEIRKNNTRTWEYEVKLFGGGVMFAKNESPEMVGAKNIAAVRELANKYNLIVKAESLGGNVHRRINFELWNGIVNQKSTQHS